MARMANEKRMGVGSIAIENHKKRKMFAGTFRRTFDIDLEKFWSPIFGFDVVRFDTEFLIPKHKYDEDKESMSDVVLRVYGETAVKLIKELI